MSRVKNTLKVIEEAADKINLNYDLRTSNIQDIFDASNGSFDMICKGFNFGYMQGMKATKAELRKRGAAL